MESDRGAGNAGTEKNMRAPKTKRKIKTYNLIVLAAGILILFAAWSVSGTWNLPSSRPVRGTVRLLPEKRPESYTLIFERGQDLTHAVERHYGRANPTILDMILEANPAIKDINRIPVNQKILMPPLIEHSFVLPSPDSRYRIHLGTFDHIPALQPFKDESVLKGKTVEIVVRTISPRERWYRVTAGPFSTQEEAVKTLSALRCRGISF